MQYNTELELIFYKYDGLAFQAFFNELMTWGVSGFCPIRQRNDGGNDGFVRETGTFYQVFAPESVTSSVINKASSKMIEDFDKLAKNWHYTIQIKEYIFVINDKFKGADTNLTLRIAQLSKERGIKTKILTSHNLLDLFHSNLNDTQKRILITRHSIGTTSDPALKIAAKIISRLLPIEKWKKIDEQLDFFSIRISDLNILSEIRSKLFSMDFNPSEFTIVKDLIDSLTRLSDLFYTTNTTERHGERVWDKSWKLTNNNPMADHYVKEQANWESQIFEFTVDFCQKLNRFNSFIRESQIPDFLDYQNYTIVRRKVDSIDEYIEILP